MISLEMLGDVLLPHNWKEFVFHRGSSFNLTSTLQAGLIAGGREARETRHTVFFTSLNPRGTDVEEEFSDLPHQDPHHVFLKQQQQQPSAVPGGASSGGVGDRVPLAREDGGFPTLPVAPVVSWN